MRLCRDEYLPVLNQFELKCWDITPANFYPASGYSSMPTIFTKSM